MTLANKTRREEKKPRPNPHRAVGARSPLQPQKLTGKRPNEQAKIKTMNNIPGVTSQKKKEKKETLDTFKKKGKEWREATTI